MAWEAVDTDQKFHLQQNLKHGEVKKQISRKLSKNEVKK